MSDKATVSSIWDFSLTPMQWRIDPSDRERSYMYVILQTSPRRLFIAITIRISDLDGRRYWSLSSAYLETPVLLFPLMFVDLKAEVWIYIRLNSTDSSAMTASDGISYPRVSRSGPTCVLVCMLDIFIGPKSHSQTR